LIPSISDQVVDIEKQMDQSGDLPIATSGENEPDAKGSAQASEDPDEEPVQGPDEEYDSLSLGEGSVHRWADLEGWLEVMGPELQVYVPYGHMTRTEDYFQRIPNVPQHLR
jgi:hypothetical protein